MRYQFTCLLVFFSFLCFSQGSIENKILYSKSLENPGGENPNRDISIYLPEKYQDSNKAYPVIYFMPGITYKSTDIMSELKPLLDKAIASGEIKPVIVVIPDHYTLYRGSYFSNSPLIGDWVTYTNTDVVKYIDQNYRTLAKKESRAIAGWSSGAFGALKIGMQSTDVFANIYALSPGLLILSDEFAPTSQAFKRLTEIKTRETLIEGWTEGFPNIIAAAGRALAPNPDKPPFYIDMPVTFSENGTEIHDAILKKWNAGLPFYILDTYAANLRTLNSFKLEWGRNDDFKNVISSCRAFSKKLENLGIQHLAEEYNGTHFNKIFTENGRIAKDMLPLLDDHLVFD